MATGISAAVVNLKPPATFRQSAEPTAWRGASIASCGGRAGFSDNGGTEQATVTSNDVLQTWDAFSEAMRVRLGAAALFPKCSPEALLGLMKSA